MFKKKTYPDVVEMVRDAGADPAFVDDLAGHLADRRLVRRLFALRCARGLSQKDIAEKMGCTQGRISKLEASRDEDLRLGDLRDYARALGLTTILGFEGGPTAVARIKFHHACVESEVETLAKLARDEEREAGMSLQIVGPTGEDHPDEESGAEKAKPQNARQRKSKVPRG